DFFEMASKGVDLEMDQMVLGPDSALLGKTLRELGLPQRLGAQVVIDPSDGGLAGAVRAELPDGVDFIVDATGEPAAVEEAFELLAPGGTFMLFGVCPAGSSISFDPHELFRKEAKIIGSKMPPGTLDRAARLIEAGRIACDEIVTATLPIERAAESVEGFNAHRDRHVKVAIDPWAPAGEDEHPEHE
ncbi:hypothetical protein LCGC14_2001720, partial [marine sediment metagenome]